MHRRQTNSARGIFPKNRKMIQRLKERRVSGNIY